MNALTATVRRDLTSAFRHFGQFLLVPVFFVLATILFPLAIGTDAQLLTLAAPGLITIAALFSALLPLDHFFADDRRDGTLDYIALSAQPLALFVAGKMLSHWLLTGLPLVLIAPALSVMLGLTGYPAYVVGALIPTSILFGLTGGLGAALTLGAKQGSVLLALLIVPLYIPVLIFCAGAIDLARGGEAAATPLLLLWAMLAFALPVAPLVTGAILKWQLRG